MGRAESFGVELAMLEEMSSFMGKARMIFNR